MVEQTTWLRDGDQSDGTHEGKIPGTFLLGECPVLSHGWT